MLSSRMLGSWGLLSTVPGHRHDARRQRQRRCRVRRPRPGRVGLPVHQHGRHHGRLAAHGKAFLCGWEELRCALFLTLCSARERHQPAVMRWQGLPCPESLAELARCVAMACVQARTPGKPGLELGLGSVIAQGVCVQQHAASSWVSWVLWAIIRHQGCLHMYMPVF